jgi:hypothetical protein
MGMGGFPPLDDDFGRLSAAFVQLAPAPLAPDRPKSTHDRRLATERAIAAALPNRKMV